MIANQILKIYYCRKCGWSISNKVLETIIGTNDLIKYCEECGAKLKVNKIGIESENSYPIEDFFHDIKKEILALENIYKKIIQ